MADSSASTRQRVAVFDLDGTITQRDTYVQFLLSVLRSHPLRLIPAAWLPVAVLMHKAGLRDNTWLKKTFLKAIVAGMTRSQVNTIAERFVSRLMATQLRPGALAAMRQHVIAGDQIVLLSASFDFYVTVLAARLQIPVTLCTQSKWREERLTADIMGDNCYGAAKLSRIKTWIGADRSKFFVIAYTDHHSDQGLLAWADEAVAVNPTPRLHDYCKKQGYRIDDWGRATHPTAKHTT